MKHRHIAFCFLPHAPMLLLGIGALYGGYLLLLPVAFLLALVPLLDTVTGWQDDSTFQKEDFTGMDKFLLNWNTRLYASSYVAAVIWFAKMIPQFSAAEAGFVIGSMSILGGIAFAASHELLHGKERIDQVLQRITTAFLFYPHYKLIHIQSHHSHAATDHDENTAWLNETIYSYLLRTIPGSMLRCWEMEAAHHKGKLFWRRIFANRMIGYAIGQVALLVGFYLWVGLPALFFYLSQVIGAHIVLESVNYIQHYGLMRKRHETGYEKTGAEHSWDTYHFFSSYVTFRVGHHSFHHISVKPYYLLAAEKSAPKLPVGYFWAIAMVFVPPWWRRVINPRLALAAG